MWRRCLPFTFTGCNLPEDGGILFEGSTECYVWSTIEGIASLDPLEIWDVSTGLRVGGSRYHRGCNPKVDLDSIWASSGLINQSYSALNGYLKWKFQLFYLMNTAQLLCPGKMAEWLWRVTQEHFQFFFCNDMQLSILMGLRPRGFKSLSCQYSFCSRLWRYTPKPVVFNGEKGLGRELR